MSKNRFVDRDIPKDRMGELEGFITNLLQVADFDRKLNEGALQDTEFDRLVLIIRERMLREIDALDQAYALLSRFLDPKVAKLFCEGKLEKMGRHDVTIVYSDIVGYTKISGFLDNIGENTTIYKLGIAFLQELQDVVHEFGGVWDKSVGDAGIFFFGAPFTLDGKDGYGKQGSGIDTSTYDINAFKTLLKLQHRLKDINRKYEDLLYEIAADEYGNGKSRAELLRLMDENHNLKPNIQVSSSINAAKVNIGLDGLKTGRHYSSQDAEMNVAARLQGAGTAGEILVNKKAGEHIIDYLKNHRGRAIPKNEKEFQTFEDFIRHDLGIEIDPEESLEQNFDENHNQLVIRTSKEEITIRFSQEYEILKGLGQEKFAYRITFARRKLADDQLVVDMDALIPEVDLLKYNAEYKILHTDHQGSDVELRLQNTRDPQKIIRFKIAQKKLKSITTRRLVSEQEMLRRSELQDDEILKVHGGKLEYVYCESIEKEFDTQVQNMTATLGANIANDNYIPPALYTLVGEGATDTEYRFTLKRDTSTFNAAIPKGKIRVIEDMKELEDDEELGMNLRNHIYAYQRREESSLAPTNGHTSYLIYKYKDTYYKISLKAALNNVDSLAA